jgi:hypothetical protein
VAFEDMTATDLDVNSFDTETCANGTANGTSGITTTTTVTATAIDSVVAGRPLRIAVRRDTSVGGNMSGIAQLTAAEVRTAN